MTRVAVLDDYQGVALELADWSQLPADAEVTVFREHMDGDDAVAAALADYDVVCVMRERTPFGAALFTRLPRLQLLVTSGAKNAAIDVTAAKEHGVTVCGTRSPAHAASELAWGLMLALGRQIVTEDRDVRAGRWQTTVGRDMNGATLGVVGLGRHGANAARIGLAFGMRVIAWSTNLDAARCAEVGVELADRETLFREADYITVHLQQGKRNVGLIGAADLALMKPTAYIVNTSRGPIVDETALVAALREGRIGGAGLDVFDQEPLPAEHPFLGLANTVLTSHVGFVTEDTYRVFYGETVEAVARWLAGDPVRVIA